MTELLTAAQMRAIEASAIASGEVTDLALMERAGRGVVEAVFEEWPELASGSHRAEVLCGPGNNGGDGFVVARLLRECGWEVAVFLIGLAERQPPSAAEARRRWTSAGGDVADLAREHGQSSTQLRVSDLLVDAMFGTGLSRPMPAPASRACNHRARHRVSIDLPSGLCSDSGRRIVETGEDQVFQADLVVTFQRNKLGHFLGDGPDLCTKVVVKDIGLDVSDRPTDRVSTDGEKSVVKNEPEPGHFKKTARLHKYAHGHALILSGPSGRGGAARLSARGAIRIGAGVVTVGSPADALAEHSARLDAIMLRRMEDAGALAELLADKRINAVCLGPGLGLDGRAAELVKEVLAGRREPRATVLDADALTALAEQPDLFALLHERCVLTPHAGEFARLFPDIAAKLAAPATTGPACSKVDATREAAARAGCVVLFKGADTVIAGPSGRCSINSAAYDRAAPWLATAGSGDVLAGFIAGLLARGFHPMQAAEGAAWLHVECARSFGPGLIAEDLPEELPRVFRSLGL